MAATARRASGLLTAWQRRLESPTRAVALCVIAGACSSFLAGVNFPAMNNIWHVPVVLGFFASPEGPHDSFNESFVHFVSAFWIPFKLIVTEDNIRTVFVGIQIAGNAFLSASLFALLRAATGSVALSGVVAAGFSFCSGLSSPTRLGYSELFSTYATHTEFSIALCLLSFACLIRERHVWAAVALSLAADANLFMAAWSALAIGLFMLGAERRLLTREQLGFFALFGVLSAPVLVWALRSGASSGTIPLNFFHAFLGPHVYALDFPQPAVETFALGGSAALATLTLARGHRLLHRLGMITLACVAALGLGTALPYLLDVPLLLLSHPLRFTSLVVALAATCAGSSLLVGLRQPRVVDPLAAFVAAAGFLLGSPVVSTFGFAAMLYAGPRVPRQVASALAGIAVLGLFLASPDTDVRRNAVAFLLLCVTLAAAVLRGASGGQQLRHALTLLSATLLGLCTAAPPSLPVTAATLLAIPCVAVALLPSAARLQRAGVAVSVAASLLVLLTITAKVSQLVMLVAWVTLVAALAYAWRARAGRLATRLSTAVLASILVALLAAGLVRGAQSHFDVALAPDQQDFLSAQHWARRNTLPDSVFLAAGVSDGFQIGSRRPVWWELTQGAAVLWMPDFFQLWSCRQHEIEAARAAGRVGPLAVAANIDYVLFRVRASPTAVDGFAEAFRNGGYVIFRRTAPKLAAPLCRDLKAPA